jgi:hypothetical protein
MVTGLENWSQLIDRCVAAIARRENETAGYSFGMRMRMVVVGCAAYGAGLPVFFRRVTGLLPHTFRQMKASPMSSNYFVCCDERRHPLVVGRLRW